MVPMVFSSVLGLLLHLSPDQYFDNMKIPLRCILCKLCADHDFINLMKPRRSYRSVSSLFAINQNHYLVFKHSCASCLEKKLHPFPVCTVVRLFVSRFLIHFGNFTEVGVMCSTRLSIQSELYSVSCMYRSINCQKKQFSPVLWFSPMVQRHAG